MTTSRAPAAEPVDFEIPGAASDDPAHDEGRRLGRRIERLGDRFTRFTSTRPLLAVGMAAGVGFLLGRVERMRR